MFRPLTAATAMLFAALVGSPSAMAQSKLKTYQSKYYVLHTDLERDAVRETELRITAMAEEYHARTRGFAGSINRKMDFYLFKDPADYYAAGGFPNSAGVYDPNTRTLRAIAGEKTGSTTWHVVQHEGFHQFVHNVIGGEIPIWVNEGLAEYFGQALFTGDGYVMGVIPPERLKRIKLWIQENHAISIASMMKLQHETWNVQMSIVNYDQAWSMVYFLAHAENGKYQKAFNNFIRDCARGGAWEQAWSANFGNGVKSFEKKWEQYWTQMDEDPTADLYARATALTLTSFYARAFSQQQYFETADAFFDAARDGKLKSHADDWLPPALLASAIKRAGEAGTWSVEKRGGKFALVCTSPDAGKLVGTFSVRHDRRIMPESVKVEQQKGGRGRP